MDKKIEEKRWSLKRILLVGGTVILFSFFAFSVYKDTGVSRLNVDRDRVLLDTIERGVFHEFITVSGIVEPIRTVFIDAVEGGRIEELLVEDGTMVEESEAILRLSNDELKREYFNLEAQLVTQINQIRSISIVHEQQSLNLKEQALDANYQITQLSKRYDRNKDLYQDEIISEVDWEQIEDEFEYQRRRRDMLRLSMEKDSLSSAFQKTQMETTVDLMKRNLTFAKESLENLLVRSPLSGQLSSFDWDIGQLISRGQKIAQVDDLTSFKIRAQVDEYYISRIFVNQTGSFMFDDEQYALRIKKIYPDVVNGTFAVDLIFDGDRPQAIKRGQSLTIKLALSNEIEANLLARGSFYQITGGNWVYLVDPEKQIAYKKEIKINKQNPEFFEVEKGLNPGDIVIVSSYDNYGNRDEIVFK